MVRPEGKYAGEDDGLARVYIGHGQEERGGVTEVASPIEPALFLSINS